MNKQLVFHGKQPNTHSTVKRPTMLTLVSNFRNFCSASPSFWQSVCKNKVFFIICVHRTSNRRLDMIERNKSSWRPMSLHKRATQGQARWQQQWIPFSDAPHNNTARIHLLLRLQKAFHTPHSWHDAQQLAATRNKSLQSGVHNQNPYINLPSRNPILKDR